MLRPMLTLGVRILRLGALILRLAICIDGRRYWAAMSRVYTNPPKIEKGETPKYAWISGNTKGDHRRQGVCHS